eukprot:gnl/Trimastix_PCT/1233.p2 GENE.gnl/Trimastix_PCT/1233~~gnl/Trimastix_PCT/1233.p2  ORF type:complete len:114 (-),score=45.36 gnl/Trimastix_PCT/1233:62-403(-)
MANKALSDQGRAGIQRLLEAERMAADSIANAKREKVQLLKRAKEEAQSEIDAFRAAKEEEYQSQRHEVSNETTVAKMEANCESLLSEIRTHEEAHRGEIIDMLLDAAMTVSIE